MKSLYNIHIERMFVKGGQVMQEFPKKFSEKNQEILNNLAESEFNELLREIENSIKSYLLSNLTKLSIVEESISNFSPDTCSPGCTYPRSTNKL